jgi:hypothetical protein
MNNSNSTHKSTRLDLIDQDLDQTIKAYNTKKAKNAIQLLAKYIKDQHKTDDAVIELYIDYLSNGETIPKELLKKFILSAENLEIKYLNASDDFEAGLTDEEQVTKCFFNARIASALLWATETNPYIALGEMIYEANASLQNFDQLKQLVLSVK